MSVTQRYKSLDFLRGVAVIMVMLEHYEITWLFTHIGWSGVDLFFVLSGFFVSGIIFAEYKKTGLVKAGRFLLRRGLKIWPLFYFTLIVHAVYFIAKGTPPTGRQIFAEMFFYQNFVEGIIYISWSLGLEEQFYIFLALISLLLLHKNKPIRMVWMCVVLMILCPVLRFVNYSLHPEFTLFTHHFPTYLRMDALASGILVSYLFHFHKEAFFSFVNKYRYVLVAMIGVCMLPLLFFYISDFTMNVFGLTTTYLAFAMVVCILLGLLDNQRANRVFALPVMSGIAWIGYYSYSIYLFHFSFGFGMANFARRHMISQAPAVIFDLIYLVSNIFIGYVSSRLIERPFLKWREQWLPSPVPVVSKPVH